MLTKLAVKRAPILCCRLPLGPEVSVPESCFGLTNSLLVSVGVNDASWLFEQLAKQERNQCLKNVQKVLSWETHEEAPS